MAKKTLLQLTQNVLNDISGDVVSDISDTTESDQIAEMIIQIYSDLVNLGEWEFAHIYDNLTDANSATVPTKFTFASNVSEIQKIWYNVRLTADTQDIWREIKYLHPEDFIALVNARDSDDANTDETDIGTGVTLNLLSDQMPHYWTTFDQSVIWMDSYDSDEETFLVEEKTQVLMKAEAAFTKANGTTMTAPLPFFNLLLHKAKSKAFRFLKQDIENANYCEREYRKLYGLLVNNGHVFHPRSQSPNWGR